MRKDSFTAVLWDVKWKRLRLWNLLRNTLHCRQVPHTDGTVCPSWQLTCGVEGRKEPLLRPVVPVLSLSPAQVRSAGVILVAGETYLKN